VRNDEEGQHGHIFEGGGVSVLREKGVRFLQYLLLEFSSLDSFSSKYSSFSSIRSNCFVTRAQINYYGNNIFS